MAKTTIVGNGTVVTGGPSPKVLEGGAVAWQGGRIVAVGDEAELCSRQPEAGYLDARGGLIAPGFINLHHHFYSALARGLDPGVELRDFSAVLEGLWWRLDKALDREAVRVSAQLTAADCIRWGCTTVFDHHASPSFVRGSLDTIAEVVERAGLSALLCYEISDRNGNHEAMAAIEENVDFCSRRRLHPTVRGTMGIHASFTVADDTLREIARRRPEASGCHIHVAEDQLDLQVSNVAYGAGPVQRLQWAGLLDDHALLAHGVHLGRDEFEAIAAAESVLIHNPESNANNGVGRLNVVEASRLGCLVGIGTDGMASAMGRAVRCAFLVHRAALRDPRVGFEAHPQLLANNAITARRFFDEPLLGELVPEAPADIAVIDAATPTPMSPDNLFGHLVYGFAEAPIRHTIARGRVLLEDFHHTTLDTKEIAAHARRIAPAVWERFREQAPPKEE